MLSRDENSLMQRLMRLRAQSQQSVLESLSLNYWSNNESV